MQAATNTTCVLGRESVSRQEGKGRTGAGSYIEVKGNGVLREQEFVERRGDYSLGREGSGYLC